MVDKIFVLGAPRTGFTLLISIINELSQFSNSLESKKTLEYKSLVNIASISLKSDFFTFFQDKIDMNEYMYNGEFDLLVGGPKWINQENKNEAVIRKYIGIKDNGDFTFLLYLPKSALNYDRVVHSHYYPKSWVEDSFYDAYLKFASVRNPMGVINSAVFSINAITSEYITNYIDDFDEDEFREVMAQYKLTDLDLFEGLVRFLKEYLDEFISVMQHYKIIKWEDIINSPYETITTLSKLLDVTVSKDEIEEIWSRLDHKNLPKHHLYNFRKGHGIVGEWKKRLTNHHLKIFEKYNFNHYLKILGYDEIEYFDETLYSEFQKEINEYLNRGEICNKIEDDNLFKFCWNKSNIAQTKHKFDRFQREGSTKLERSSLKDKELALMFAKQMEPKVTRINEMMRFYEKSEDFSLTLEHFEALLSEELDAKERAQIENEKERVQNMQKLELRVVDVEEFEENLNILENFNIVSDSGYAKSLREKYADKQSLSSPNIVITEDDPTLMLQNYLHKHSGVVLAKKGKKYFKNQSLFLISIPKAGTHLLFELAKAFGYREGGVCPENPKGGYWYYTEFSNSHTSAKHFFKETVYRADFGNRDHPFVYSPALFMYRNPLDIVASEANYYHKETKTAFFSYLSTLSYDERLMRLIDDKWLLGSIRDRMSEFVAWNYFQNVISLSFEELIGEKGGGDEAVQKALIWSLQLKLQVPGKPLDFAKQLFNPDSSTFFKGQIGGHRELFKEEHFEKFRELESDFMDEFGYSLGSMSKFSSKTDLFRAKKLHYNDMLEFPPILKVKDFFAHNIVKYKKSFYGIPHSLGSVDLEKDALESSILINDDIEKLKLQIMIKAENG